MASPTVNYALTIGTVGSGTIHYKLTVNPAASILIDPISYKYTLQMAGAKSPTIEYLLSIGDVGNSEIFYTWTIGDVHFVFSGAAPVCDVNSPFVITSKPLPAIIPTAPGQNINPAIPEFNWQNVFNQFGTGVNVDLNAMGSAINQMQSMMQQMGNALNAMKQRLQNDEKNQSKNQKNQQPGSFQEVRGARVTSQHKITNPDDDTQFVKITQIDGLLFQNKQGQTLRWSR